ncbi:MAG TPA: hemolysin family protein [Tepidisphaeraceae bacterium]|jgi:CBS domain containing-hemolysin-like protein|nr:hemolysin family protein [Tepidisphaeraceae bacterium]
MPLFWLAATILIVAIGSLLFSTLTYALRDLPRARLAEFLERRGKSQWLEPTLDHTEDLILATAFFRMVFNTALVVLSLGFVEQFMDGRLAAYALAALLAAVITLLCSVSLAHSLAQHAAAEVVGTFAPFIHTLRALLRPLTWFLRGIDDYVRKATGPVESHEAEQLELEQEILSVVEEGEKDGVMDTQEREMIESVIEFRDTTAGQIMTPRPQIVAIDIDSTLEQVRQAIEDSGHSRIPVYRGTLDQIVGILYARDLLRYIGQPAGAFDIKSAMRPPFYVPETKPSRELLRDFRLQKVHIAVVLDEYGGTAGLVTIEDILEQIVGDISDEHEPIEPAMFKRLSETASEADAQIEVPEFNRLTGLNLPEDAGYTTLGGYLSTALGRIPPAGTVFEQNGTKFTVIEAEPQKINRVKIEQQLQPVGET